MAAICRALLTLPSIPDAAEWPHMNRWVRHIMSFPKATRDSWTKSNAQAFTHGTSAPAKKEEAKPKAAAPKKAAPAKKDDAPKADAEDDDSDMDFFDSDDDDEAAAAADARREAVGAAHRAKKGKVIGKSTILFDVKPWGADTDMAAVEAHCRTAETMAPWNEPSPSGAGAKLKFGAAKLVPVAFGIKKLSLVATVIDDDVDTEELTDYFTSNEDLIQSCDIAGPCPVLPRRGSCVLLTLFLPLCLCRCLISVQQGLSKVLLREI